MDKMAAARELYMGGMGQAEVARVLGVPPSRMARWARAGGWREARAARAVTRPALVAKTLAAIGGLLDRYEAAEAADADALADRLVKLGALVERLDGGGLTATVDAFVRFGAWLGRRRWADPEAGAEFLSRLTELQDEYVRALAGGEPG